ncbi:hypothetical protein EWE75_07920 [Sphingomonas populi]|uniref:Uncharacterized protein n=1 Tax=Sphingomonas populi TaxID=2484750 RepID=A0A4Q6XYF4_9SPHN|nr:hypothetical protein [Sphingomonas populi]RZF65021.1 hypothetical protein EWE75_07920 [Sphingomonas populi]
MTETMLQRVTRTLQDLTSATGSAEGARDAAMTLLKAMREPGAGMAEAGAEVVPGDDPAIHAEVATDVWRAMIDEALNEDFAEHPAMAGEEDVARQQSGRSHDERDDWQL